MTARENVLAGLFYGAQAGRPGAARRSREAERAARFRRAGAAGGPAGRQPQPDGAQDRRTGARARHAAEAAAAGRAAGRASIRSTSIPPSRSFGGSATSSASPCSGSSTSCKVLMNTCEHLIVLHHGEKLAEGAPQAVAGRSGASPMPISARRGAASLSELLSVQNVDVRLRRGPGDLGLLARHPPGRGRRPVRRQRRGQDHAAARHFAADRRRGRAACASTAGMSAQLEAHELPELGLDARSRRPARLPADDGAGESRARRLSAPAARGGRRERMAGVFELFPGAEGAAAKSAAGVLSGGQQQMLAIGRGLMADPEAADARRAVARACAGGGGDAVRGHPRRSNRAGSRCCWSSRTSGTRWRSPTAII